MRQFILYNNDAPVAHFTEEFTLIKEFHPDVPELLPMQIRSASADGFAMWIRERAIDLNTVQHRNMVNEMYGNRDKISLALLTHMFSISDTFTCFPEGEFISRAGICDHGDQNFVSQYILVSSDTSIQNRRIASPNVSTDGSFPKSWVFEDDAWWLYKIQSEAATRSEVEISRVLRSCGWDAAEYAYVGGTYSRVRTRNFVKDGSFFEPYQSFRYAFLNPSDEDDAIYSNIASLGPEFAEAWDRILLADSIFMNTDRHMRNFGVIRSAATGKVLKLAPNFDNNQAYLANPGGKYSSSMLDAHLRKMDHRIKDDLEVLVNACHNSPYLAPAVEAARKYL